LLLQERLLLLLLCRREIPLQNSTEFSRHAPLWPSSRVGAAGDQDQTRNPGRKERDRDNHLGTHRGTFPSVRPKRHTNRPGQSPHQRKPPYRRDGNACLYSPDGRL
jgi:hypothetical protein